MHCLRRLEKIDRSTVSRKWEVDHCSFHFPQERIMNKTIVSLFLVALAVCVATSVSVAAEPPQPVQAVEAVVVVDQPIGPCVPACCPAPCVPCDPCVRPARHHKVRCFRPVPAPCPPPCCEPVVCNIPCVKAVQKVGCFGRCRTVYVLCDCACCQNGCCESCDGCVQKVRVGCRIITARICTCCCPAPCAPCN